MGQPSGPWMRGTHRSRRCRVWARSGPIFWGLNQSEDWLDRETDSICLIWVPSWFGFPKHLHLLLQAIEPFRCQLRPPNFEGNRRADLYSGRRGWGQEIFVHKNQIEDGRELISFIRKTMICSRHINVFSQALLWFQAVTSGPESDNYAALAPGVGSRAPDFSNPRESRDDHQASGPLQGEAFVSTQIINQDGQFASCA